MYIIDDICYTGELQKGIKASAAKPLRGHMPLITFSTSEKRLFDATTLKGSAFEPLKDESTLADFNIFHGVMTRPDCEIDLAPETMYREGFPYSDEAA